MNSNKILVALFLAVAAVSGLNAPARADAVTNPQELRFTIPKDSRATPDEARKWSVPEVCKTSLSATCVVCATNGVSGIVVGVEVSSGAVGSYAVALDTGAIPTAGLVGPPAASGAGSLITRQKTCEYTLATVDTNKGACGHKEFSDGVPFSTGLTICGSADVQTIVRFRTQRK